MFNKIKSAFFSVNVVARKPQKNTPSTNPYVKKFLNKTLWKPTKVAVFAGKVNYPSYKFLDKHIIRFIMWLTKGPTDISKSYEFTNWNDVTEFGKIIKEM
jgi:menaquinone-dependent protoporphyrinogen oxidase